MSTEGLYDRIRFDRDIGALRAQLLYVAARLIHMFADAMPSDAQYFVFRKPG
jgi:hypothetical protein